MRDFKYIKNEILNLASEIELLPRADFANIKMFLDNAEYGLALDTLCSQLYEYQIKISLPVYKRIIKVTKLMGLSSELKYLKELMDKTL